jgi:hypothetical protein
MKLERTLGNDKWFEEKRKELAELSTEMDRLIARAEAREREGD